ncbi:MAG TPA: cytochrome c oxidase subunit 4 [Streptosporangiaceae bacterium]|nr:cytochrome c oxidase subunit 4 [Streptosporangiaceae bacterium]
MTLLSRIFTGLGAFLIVMGITYGLVTNEWEGTTEMLTAAGGGLLIGVYLTRAVQRARAAVAAQAAGAGPAGDSEPHVPPTIWPLVFALSTIGIVLGSVGPRWVLAAGAVVLIVSLIGWSLDVRRQWSHHDHAAGAGAAPGGAHRRTGA